MEPELHEPEALAEEEPRYLRRQKPLEIKRRKLGKPTWQLYRRVAFAGLAAVAGGWLLFQAVHFVLYSPHFALTDLEEIRLAGNHQVTRQMVLETFAADRRRSVLRVPLT